MSRLRGNNQASRELTEALLKMKFFIRWLNGEEAEIVAVKDLSVASLFNLEVNKLVFSDVFVSRKPIITRMFGDADGLDIGDRVGLLEMIRK